MKRFSLAIFASVVLAEWRAMLRNRVAIAGVLLMLLLTLTAILVSREQMHSAERDRLHFQSKADEQWAAQPDRHPHRVVHYGHFIFRPHSALAFFDFGIAPMAGNTLYLEGHRQNSANFSDASQSSVLLRFGQLTPAYVLQVLTPLLIVFLAFGSVARERELGQLRLLMASGTRGATLLWGKLASHAALALLLAAPAYLALLALALGDAAIRSQALWMMAGYTLYLWLWVFVAVLVSASVARARDALLLLVGIWMVTVVLLPRLMPDVAGQRIAEPSPIETEVAIHQALARYGDSHNPDDPYFAQFKARTLAAYDVSRVEDLPVNYGGLVTEEGERLSGALFAEAMAAGSQRQAAQAGIVQQAAIASPVLALRRLSSALAGTSLDTHARFLREGEAYRFALIQALNRLHVNEVRFKNDRDQRISNSHWQSMPRFAFAPDDSAMVVERHVLPGIAVFDAWLALFGLAAVFISRRLERTGQ